MIGFEARPDLSLVPHEKKTPREVIYSRFFFFRLLKPGQNASAG